MPGCRHSRRHRSFRSENWKAPASNSTPPPMMEGRSASHAHWWTSRWGARSPARAATPKTVHTTTYPSRNEALATVGRGWDATARVKRTISGRLDGSIIATIISCQATRNSPRAAHSGRPPSARCPCSNSTPRPLSCARTVTIHATAMAIRIGAGGSPARARKVEITRSAPSGSRPGWHYALRIPTPCRIAAGLPG